MKKLPVILGRLLFATMLCLSFASVQAEDPIFSEAELDQMMAPIALYPDSLLAQVLMAATYPADVAEAVRWSKNNPDRDGDAAVEAVQDKSWDPSVMSLVAFPQVLAMMGEKPDWVQDLGDAFLADPEGVMDTAQKLRNKARDEGNLETTEQQKVIVEQPSSSETIIVIEPADPKVVYVPSYNPTIIYGAWWWPRYTPWYYRPYGWGFGSAVVRGIGFGIGVGITHALWGGCHWGRGHSRVNINVNRYNSININRNRINVNSRNTSWKHNSNHRRGVPYRDGKSRKQFANKRGGADQRRDYRGRDAQRDKARATMDKRGVDPTKGRRDLKGAGGDRARDSLNRANRDVARGKPGDRSGGKSRDAAGSVNRDRAKRSPQTRDVGKSRDTGRQHTKSRDNAFKGAGNTQKTRQSVNRGHSSNRSMKSRSGGGRAGGGRAGGGGGRGR